MTEQARRTLKEFVQSQLETQDNPELEYHYFISTLSVGSASVGEPYVTPAYVVHNVVHEVNIEGGKRFFQTFEYEIKNTGNVHVKNLPQPTLDNVFEVGMKEEVVRTFSKDFLDNEED